METNIDEPKPYLGKQIIIEKHFKVPGTFESIYAANKWLTDNGYDYGSSDATKPTAITIGNYYSHGLPHKWHNFDKEDLKKICGCITGDMRDGPVIVRIFKK